MIQIVLLIICSIAGIVTLILCLINSSRWVMGTLRHRECAAIGITCRRNFIFLCAILLFLCILVVFTQLMATTPAIKDEKGRNVDGSIAELKCVELNGHKEWITIRGWNKEAPILLFLAGGPGGTQLAATRYELSELEKHFVVVNWDQPGSGKSNSCMSGKNITVDTYIEDGIALTEYLRSNFQKDKIYMIGESWGSALGIFLIDKKPEYYAGFIGTGQMVDFAETEKIDYKFALDIAKERGDDKVVNSLIEQGEAPYYSGNIALQSSTYYNYLNGYMIMNPQITNGGYNTFRDMFASEYGILDSVNYMLGLMNTFNVVYPTLYETDLRKDYATLEVPIYFFIGRHDVNAPTALAEDYYELLEAPEKEWVWFEHSGHGPWLNETEKFVNETLRVFQVQ